jgi:hypothetical protein
MRQPKNSTAGTILTKKHARISSADLSRAASFLQRCGAKVAAMDILPGRIKITTTDGSSLALDEDRELDEELEAFRKAHA